MFDDLKTTAGYVIASLLSLAMFLPKLLNQIKGEGINGSVMDRVKELEKSRSEMDDKIHKYAMRTTRLCVAIIRLESLLAENNITVPKDLQADLDQIKQESEEDEGEGAK